MVRRFVLACGLLLVSALFASEVNAQVYHPVYLPGNVWIPVNQGVNPPPAIAIGPMVKGARVKVITTGGGGNGWRFYKGVPHMCGAGGAEIGCGFMYGTVVFLPGKGFSVALDQNSNFELYMGGEAVSSFVLPAAGADGYSYSWWFYNTNDEYKADADRRDKAIKAYVDAKIDAAKEPDGKGEKPAAVPAKADEAPKGGGAAPVKAEDVGNPANNNK